MSLANMMWQTQEVLHKKNNPIVPGGILLIAGTLVVYRHMTHDAHQDVLKSFLAMIVVQMLPLVALEMKIMSCADPVGLFCKFAVPVTMIHAVFLSIRFCIMEFYDSRYLWCSGIGLAGAILTLLMGFRWSPLDIFHHKSVWTLTIVAILGACFTQWVDSYFNPDSVQEGDWKGVLEVSNSYLEIIAFVPALWAVYREDQGAGRLQIEELDTKRTSTAFFLFLVCFYMSEDLINSVDAWEVSGMATAGHILHFLLLMDFACYILAHIYNPEKLMGEVRKWLPVDMCVGSYNV